MADAGLGGGAMTASRAPRSNRAGRPCPPRCVTGHDELRLCHFDEQHAILPDGEGIRVCAAAINDPGRYADRAPFVMLHGSHLNGPGALARVPVREAEDLAAIIGMLAAATPDQHRELAEPIRAATAVIAQAGTPAPRAGQR
jgi:hypothetical protein